MSSGTFVIKMDSNSDITNNTIRLLSTIDLDEATAAVADVVGQICAYRALAILIWDEDLESFGEQFLFGTDRKDFSAFAKHYAGSYEHDVEELKLIELAPH